MNSRNNLKMQRYVIFIRKNLQINMLKINNMVKLWDILIIKVNIELLQIACVI